MKQWLIVPQWQNMAINCFNTGVRIRIQTSRDHIITVCLPLSIYHMFTKYDYGKKHYPLAHHCHSIIVNSFNHLWWIPGVDFWNEAQQRPMFSDCSSSLFSFKYYFFLDTVDTYLTWFGYCWLWYILYIIMQHQMVP